MKHISQEYIDKLNAVNLGDPMALEDLKNTILDKYVEGIERGWRCANPENALAIAESLQMGMARVEAAERGNPGLTVGLAPSDDFVATYSPLTNKITFNSAADQTNTPVNRDAYFLSNALNSDKIHTDLTRQQLDEQNDLIMNRIGHSFYLNGHEIEHGMQFPDVWKNGGQRQQVSDLGQAEREIEMSIVGSPVINRLYNYLHDDFLIEKEANGMGYISARERIGELMTHMGKSPESAEYQQAIAAFNNGVNGYNDAMANSERERQDLTDMAQRFGWQLDDEGKIVGGGPENMQTIADIISNKLENKSPEQLDRLVEALKSGANKPEARDTLTRDSLIEQIEKMQEYGNLGKDIREFEVNSPEEDTVDANLYANENAHDAASVAPVTPVVPNVQPAAQNTEIER